MGAGWFAGKPRTAPEQIGYGWAYASQWLITDGLGLSAKTIWMGTAFHNDGLEPSSGHGWARVSPIMATGGPDWDLSGLKPDGIDCAP